MEETPQRDLFTPMLDNDALAGPLLLVARLMTTTLFVYYIVLEVFQSARIQTFMDKHNLPGELMYLALAAQVVGCALIVFGYKTRFAALLLAGLSIVATLIFNIHSRINLLKDFGIAGGLLFLFANGPGPISIDALLGQAQPVGTGPNSYRGFFASVLNNNSIMGPLLFLGRVFAAVIFLVFGNNKVIHNAQMQAYMVNHNSHVPTLLIFPALILQLLGGAMLIVGYKTRYAALALSGFTIIAASLFHIQWGIQAEFVQFLTDYSLTGAILFMFVYGPGPFSIDARLGRPKFASVRA
jgi:putative oxidoreductase